MHRARGIADLETIEMRSKKHSKQLERFFNNKKKRTKRLFIEFLIKTFYKKNFLNNKKPYGTLFDFIAQRSTFISLLN